MLRLIKAVSDTDRERVTHASWHVLLECGHSATVTGRVAKPAPRPGDMAVCETCEPGPVSGQAT